MVRITHAYHPLSGRQYRLVTHRKNWGEDRVYFEDEVGRLVGVPARWTDIFGVDPFKEVAAGRAHFRPADLLLLARLIKRLESASGAAERKGKPQ